MSPEITKIIDQYLQGELSEPDRAVFEKTLSESDALRKELELQKTVYEAAKRASTRTQVKQVGKSYHFTKKLQIAGISLAVIATIATLTFFVSKSINKNQGGFSEEMIALMHKLEKESPIENLKSEFFVWNGADSIVLSDQGVLLSIPETAFLLNGKTYSGKALIQWQEAMDGATIVKSGLSTMSGDRLLESQGMFGIQAFTEDGKRLTINPKTGIYVQVPVDEYKTGMQLFEGKKNAEGIVDWQNPKPLQKIPVPVDMSQLDFYPAGYEDTLDKIKLRKDKKFRDSLYLSMESYETNPMEDNPFSGVMGTYRETYYDINFDGEKVNEKQGKMVISGEIYSSKMVHSSNANHPINIICDHVNDIKLKSHTSSYNKNTLRFSYTYLVDLKNGKPFDLDFEIEFTRYDENNMAETEKLDELTVNVNPKRSMVDGNLTDFFVKPSSVLAIWNPKFNNTNLATREFEKRMRSIHGTCRNYILDAYTQNLGKSMSEIDAKVAEKGYPDFEAFAAEQLGVVNPNNPHLKKLAEFYEKSIQKLQLEVKNNRSELERKQQKWDREIRDERIKESSRTNERQEEALEEEYNFNMKNVHKQLGKTVGFQVYGTSPIYNIDKYVMDATVARTSATIEDPGTGKTAQITYNDFSFEVENADQYKQVYAYLFPSGLNSYQRISGENGKFIYPLNNEMVYDLAIVGISEKGYSYFQKKTLKKGDLGKIYLENVSETKLNASIEQLNQARISEPMQIKDELKWLVKEQKDYKEQKMREEQTLFRHRMAKVIFPCYNREESERESYSLVSM